MIKIKMDDISMIEADYENLNISLIDNAGTSLHVIKCFSYFDISQKYSQLTAHFEDSINGRKVSMHISGSHEASFRNKGYRGGSLFMDLSAKEKL